MSGEPPPPQPEVTVVIDPGTGAPIRGSREDGGGRRPLLLLGLLVVALGIVMAVASLTEDDPPPEPPPPPLDLFDLDRVDLFGSPGADRTTFPVFGRAWGRTMLFAQRLGIVAVDLDTGDQRIWLPRDDEFAPGGWNGASFVDGTTYVSYGWGGVARVTDGRFETVVDESPPGLRAGGVYGEYGLRLGLDDRREVTFELAHLVSGTVIDVGGARRFAVLGDRVLVEHQGTIEVRDPDGGRRDWEPGELIAAGPDAVVWRECPDQGCATWAGTVDDPRDLALDGSIDETIGELRLEPWLGSRLAPVLSPGARYAPGQVPAGGALALPGLVDLVTGRTVVTGPSLGWTDDLSAAVTLIEPTVALIDTATGAAARIPLLEGAGARKGTTVTFVATNELPELDLIE